MNSYNKRKIINVWNETTNLLSIAKRKSNIDILTNNKDE